MFLVIVTTVFVGNGVPSAAVIVNSNESSLFQLRPFNTFNTDISASPLSSYLFIILYVVGLPSSKVIVYLLSSIGCPFTRNSTILYEICTSL